MLTGHNQLGRPGDEVVSARLVSESDREVRGAYGCPITLSGNGVFSFFCPITLMGWYMICRDGNGMEHYFTCDGMGWYIIFRVMGPVGGMGEPLPRRSGEKIVPQRVLPVQRSAPLATLALTYATKAKQMFFKLYNVSTPRRISTKDKERPQAPPSQAGAFFQLLSFMLYLDHNHRDTFQTKFYCKS